MRRHQNRETSLKSPILLGAPRLFGLSSFDARAEAQKARIAGAREAVKRNPTTTTFAELVATDGQLDRLLADTYSAVLQSLSPEGAVKLQEHVAYIKTKIKILPPPKMTAPHH